MFFNPRVFTISFQIFDASFVAFTDIERNSYRISRIINVNIEHDMIVYYVIVRCIFTS